MDPVAAMQCARMKAAEPRRLTYGRASRRSTVAAAAGAVDGPRAHVAAASGGRRAGRDRDALRKRGLVLSDVRLATHARRVLPRRVAGRRGFAAFNPESNGATMTPAWVIRTPGQ